MTNLKLILRTYSALRQMSADDIALLETLRALNDNDRELLLDAMTDKPAGKKASKKSSTSKSSTKSSRASSLRGKIQGTASRTITGPACATCGNVEDHPDHDVGHYLSAHEFDAGKSAAPPAPAPSPANGGAGSTTANSEIAKDTASTVAHGASGGN